MFERQVKILYFIPVVLLLLISCTEKQRTKNKIIEEQNRIYSSAKVEAKSYFKELFSNSNEELLSVLRMSECKVFGVGLLDDYLKISRSDQDPTIFEAKKTFWYKGVLYNGQKVKRIQEVKVYMKQSQDPYEFRITKLELGENKKLTTANQIITWIGLSLNTILETVAAFFGIIFLIMMISYMIFGSDVLGCGCIVLLVLFLFVPLFGYFSYVCFASWPAVALCIVLAIFAEIVIIKKAIAIITHSKAS